MDFKKRTIEQLEYSVNQKDFTGGYNFIAWLIWVEQIKGLAPILLSIAAIGCFLTLEQSYNMVVQFAVGIGCIVASGAIIYLTIKQYKELKKGISL